jgi:RNA polymerase sigma-70 factor, ECF subfamily
MQQWDRVDDAELLQAAQQGNIEAFSKLYVRYLPYVYRFLYAHLGNQEDAEDLAEEVFLRTWLAMPRFKSRGFLFRIARNALIDHYRHNRRYPPDSALTEDWRDSKQPDPAASVSADFERHQLLQMMQELPEDYRIVLSLRFIAELSPQEAAIAMEKSDGAVRVL